MDEEHARNLLESFMVGERRTALRALARMGKVQELTLEISNLLHDEAAVVRKEAALVLAAARPSSDHRASQLAEALLVAVSDADASVREETLRTLGKLGPRIGSYIVERLIETLVGEREERVLVVAAECISLMGESARLGPLLASDHAGGCRAALVAVGRSPRARLKHAKLICDCLRHSDESVRLAAVHASGEFGVALHPEHLEALAMLCSCEQRPAVRRSAVQALGRAAAAGVPHLAIYLHDKDEEVRHYAAETLGSLQDDAGEAAAVAVAGRLRESDAHVRHAALLALARLGSHGRPYTSQVARYLHDEVLDVRLAAIQAMGELGDTSVAEPLGALASDVHTGIRQAAVTALSKLGHHGSDHALLYLNDEDPAVRQAAVRVFSPLHSRLPASIAMRHADIVAQRLMDEDWRVRLASVVALGDLQVCRHADLVAALFDDENSQVRRSAITALMKMGASIAHVTAFIGDNDAAVRKEVDLALAELADRPCAEQDGELSELE